MKKGETTRRRRGETRRRGEVQGRRSGEIHEEEGRDEESYAEKGGNDDNKGETTRRRGEMRNRRGGMRERSRGRRRCERRRRRARDEDEEKEGGRTTRRLRGTTNRRRDDTTPMKGGNDVTPRLPDHTHCIEQRDGYSMPTTTIEQSRPALLVSSPFFSIISHVTYPQTPREASPSLGYIYII